jgi:hypothetical protein
MQVWYRRCALAFQAREDRSVAGYLLQNKNSHGPVGQSPDNHQVKMELVTPIRDSRFGPER